MKRLCAFALLALLGGCEALIGADFDEGRLADADASPDSHPPDDAALEADGCDACDATLPPAPKNVLSPSKGFHTCAITPSGGVKCWGMNKYGAIGDDTNTDAPKPVAVVGLGAGVIEVGAGGGHSCAVTSTGALTCWGASYSGQLGNSDLGEEHVPHEVLGLGAKVISVAVGELHTCALLETTGVKCWGENSSGQLGNDSMSMASTPVTVTGLTSGVKAISAGSKHSCALLTTGGVKCWGADVVAMGQNALTPVEISGSIGATAVACGFTHTCAIMSGGAVSCWGVGSSGYSAAAVPITAIASGATTIASGQGYSCAVVAGAAQCWGANASGQIGNNSTKSAPTPGAVNGLASGVVDIIAGVSHSCAATSAGDLYCWGAGDSGQLGDDASDTSSLVPVAVVDFP